MSRRAWLYIAVVLVLAGALSGFAFFGAIWPWSAWLPFAMLTVLATLAQLFVANGPKYTAFFATSVFLFAGVLLLPPQLFVLLALVSHAVEWAWVKARGTYGQHLRAWYIQPFNIAKHIIAGSAAHWVYSALVSAGTPMIVVLLIGAVTYLFFNEYLVGQVLVLARGLSWKETGILTVENLLQELMTLCVGASLAMLWTLDPWLSLLAFAPLALIYRALMVPKLKEEAQLDGKTNLYNARHFSRMFGDEFERAKRFNRPLTFIMADLDLLRNINNTYGHLAGDTVLIGVGKIIRDMVRKYDIAGRFGGEEFAIVLPETTLPEAMVVAERIRRAIEQTAFSVPTSPKPIRATMSLGVACFPQDAQTTEGLNHEADVAVYQAKQQGRNRVICVSDVPYLIKREHYTTLESSSAYAAAFLRGDQSSHADDGQVPSNSMPPDEQTARTYAA